MDYFYVNKQSKDRQRKMLDVTFFVGNNFSHSRDSPEMQFLLQEHYKTFLCTPGAFFFNANAQSPEDHRVQCLYFLQETNFDVDIEPVMRNNLPFQFTKLRVVSNDLVTYNDLGLVVSTLELS